ncbi:MAG: hydroxymethylbilane synthase [Lachnospiraceae bacterium]|nr:hydroxymethylbilane synthase [Lachnospiraceae bacterium]
MNKIRIGTRGSKLALKQAALVQAALQEAHSGLKTEIIVVHTKGDKIQDKPLTEIGDKGVFASELEKSLQEGEIDLAVHSAKDLPMTLAKGLDIAAVLPRGDVRDVLVLSKNGRLPVSVESGSWTAELSDRGRGTAERLDKKFVIGTGSRRRQQQAGQIWKNVVCENIRGNVDTRLQKLKNSSDETSGGGVAYQGVLLAKAGLDRLDMISRYEAEFDFYPLAPEQFLPAACQGIIAVEALQGSSAAALCRGITDAETEFCFRVEREVLLALSADCSEAIAAWCRREADDLTLDVMYAGNRQRLVCEADIRSESESGKKNAQLQAGLAMARQAARLVKEKCFE